MKRAALLLALLLGCSEPIPQPAGRRVARPCIDLENPPDFITIIGDGGEVVVQYRNMGYWPPASREGQEIPRNSRKTP